MKKNKYQMINTKGILLSAFSFLLFTSCSEQEIESFDSQKDTPITIASAGVAELSTRVITDDNVLVGTAEGIATIGVFITGGSEEKYNATNVMWEHDGTGWTSNETVLFEGVASKQQIFACSPYDASAVSGSLTVTAIEQTDWLVATSTDLTSSIVNLTMTHALTKLVLVPTFGTEVTNQTIVSVEVGGMYAEGTLKISDNTWDLGDSPATTELTMNDNKELLVIPMSNCTSFPITVNMVGNRTFKTTISLAAVDNKLEAGTQYNIKLTVGKNAAVISSVSVSDWNEIEFNDVESEECIHEVTDTNGICTNCGHKTSTATE